MKRLYFALGFLAGAAGASYLFVDFLEWHYRERHPGENWVIEATS